MKVKAENFKKLIGRVYIGYTNKKDFHSETYYKIIEKDGFLMAKASQLEILKKQNEALSAINRHPFKDNQFITSKMIGDNQDFIEKIKDCRVLSMGF